MRRSLASEKVFTMGHRLAAWLRPAGLAFALAAVGPAPVAPAQSTQALSETPPAQAQPAAAIPTVPSPTPTTHVVPAEQLVTLPRDLSPWGMFMNADIVVKAVMVGLAFASLVTWTIGLAKSLQLITARRRAVRAVRALLDADGLAELRAGQRGAVLAGGAVAAFVYAAEQERDRSATLLPDGVKERVAIALNRAEARAARAMNRGTGLVATIGSTAPFVGLFGTVWGIMNAFVGISQAHTTNLAVVAPGIAEALLATAIGLVAAIPAVVIYNQFARSIASYKALLADAAAEVMRHLSRDLDRRLQHPAE